MSTENKNETMDNPVSKLEALLGTHEIKFRAWDAKNNEWLLGYENLGGFSLTGETILMGEWGRIFWSFISDEDKDFEDLKIMQFTGMKDKNGKEIYEGDIVNIKSNFSAIVKFRNGCFYAFENYRLGGWRKEVIEVIGNVFENPELIREC